MSSAHLLDYPDTSDPIAEQMEAAMTYVENFELSDADRNKVASKDALQSRQSHALGESFSPSKSKQPKEGGSWLSLLRLAHDVQLKHIDMGNYCYDDTITFSRRSDQIGSGVSSSVFVGALRQPDERSYIAIKRIEESVASVSFRSSEDLLPHGAVMSKVSLTGSSTSQNWIQEVSNEISILCHPLLKSHRNVLGLLGFNFGLFENHFSLLTEYADLGALDFYIVHMHGLIGWDLKSKIAADIASGLIAVHLLHIVHNDVKPANVVLRSDLEARHGIVAQVSDFGSSVVQVVENHKQQYPGHRYWAAPETYMGRFEPFSVTPQRDIFSYGMLVWHLATEMPQMRETDMHVLKGNSIAFIERVLQDVATAPQAFTTVLKECLAGEPSSRCTDLRQAHFYFMAQDENFKNPEWFTELDRNLTACIAIESNFDQYSEWFCDKLALGHNPSLSHVLSHVQPIT
jgi:serine/threonine protein kinase